MSKPACQDWLPRLVRETLPKLASGALLASPCGGLPCAACARPRSGGGGPLPRAPPHPQLTQLILPPELDFFTGFLVVACFLVEPAGRRQGAADQDEARRLASGAGFGGGSRRRAAGAARCWRSPCLVLPPLVKRAWTDCRAAGEERAGGRSGGISGPLPSLAGCAGLQSRCRGCQGTGACP